jgi:hypothetical protein
MEALAVGYVWLIVFLLLWPILIWSHLREQTKLSKEQRDLLKDIKDKLSKQVAYFTDNSDNESRR